MDQLLATILLWPMNWAPQQWAFCDGSMLTIQANSALYALIGTTFGGNGTSNFALPDLRGKFAVGYDPRNAEYAIGATGGSESVILTPAQMPMHNHALSAVSVSFTVSASAAQATVSNPTATINTLAAPYDQLNANPIAGYNQTTPAIPLKMGAAPVIAGQLGMTGSSQAHENRPPFLALGYIIAVQGLFPSRP